MWLQNITIVVFLLYFFYMTRFDSMSFSRPSFPFTHNQPTFTHEITNNGSNIVFKTNSAVDWEVPLPREFIFDQGKISPADLCHGLPDGTQLLATGKLLYEYIKNYKLTNGNPTFESHSEHHSQDKRVFYFKCQHSRIHQLLMCAPGEIFVGQRCQPIDRCTGEKDGKRFANIYDIHTYFECLREKSVEQPCPPNMVFVHDRCMDTYESSLYCQFYANPRILDSSTVLKCVDGEIVYDTCPPGFQYYNRPICESNICDGKPDGTRIPLPDETKDPFHYSPGYMECLDGKIVKSIRCSNNWDLMDGKNVTHLPQVFDGNKCSVPSFCENVFSDDPDIIVPVFEFSKHVQNWKHSDMLDRITGYECRQNSRKRVALDPGYRISKYFKKEYACDGKVTRIPVSGQPDRYYDCKSSTVVLCPSDHFFDGVSCVPTIKNAFTYNGIGFFQFDSLGEDNWIKPWHYDNTPSVKPCTHPENVNLESYNLCSHPDCIKYPFLSMISTFHITLKDNSKCVFRNRRLIKEPSTEKYLYWKQRPGQDNDTCVPGRNIQTGNFVWDSTIFMTCNEEEPFVFCPSSDTASIDTVDGKKYACMPASPATRMIPILTKTKFVKNEVKKIIPVKAEDTLVMINGNGITIPPEGIEMFDGFELETLLQSVYIEYEHRMTFPPDMVLQNGVLSASHFGGAFLMKRNDFTKKPVSFPVYTIKERVNDFQL